MRPSKSAALAVLLIAPSFAAAQVPDGLPVVTLEEAVALALRVSPAMVQRQGAVETAASAGRTNGWAAYLPFLQLSSGASLASSDRFDTNTNTVVSGSSDSYNARVTSGFDLFTGFRRGAAHDQAKANSTAAEASLMQSRFQTALAARQAFFDVLRADETIRSAQATLERARASFFPSLSVSGGYTWNHTDLALGGGRTSWNTGLSLSYPLFNRFTREDNHERAKMNARTTQCALDDARRQARAGVRTAIDDLRFAEQQIVIAREAAAVAAEDLRVQQTRYELGASTILDQITSQASLAGSELNLIAARYDYLVAPARLEALVGREF